MQDLFLGDHSRAQTMSKQVAGLRCDYSKNRLTHDTLDMLLQLAEGQHVSSSIEALFAGDCVNGTEQRPALHTLLRTPMAKVPSGQQGMATEVQQTLLQMQQISDDVQQGVLTGFNQERITDIINIGIGGSDLGPMMLSEALAPYLNPSLSLHFFSSCDEAFLRFKLASLNPATTLVVIVSKSFTTQETMLNATIVKDWLMAAAQDESVIARQVFAVTAQVSKAQAFGIAMHHVLPMWDWVGGRYSVWSAVSLSVVIALGMDHFKAFLAGAHAMDMHFKETDFCDNLPVVLALIGVWYQNFLDAPTRLVVPYSSFLSSFPRYLQQLCMESQGKQVTQQGEAVEFATGAIFWGESGTNSQHSFHQLLMQGTHLIPVDFILPKRCSDGTSQPVLASHAIAQSQVLMSGYADDAQRHKIIPGNVPSNFITLDVLDPFHLGLLIALYEHMVFVQSLIWDINAFDQWGVERGKVMASQVLSQLQSGVNDNSIDGSTAQLIRWCSDSMQGQ